MAWQQIGTVTFGPATNEAVVGSIEVPAAGGFEVRVRQLSGPHPFKFGFCLLSYRSSLGRELGTVKVWPKQEGEDYVLGRGQQATDRTGVLVLEPRSRNLRWVDAGFSLTLEVLADLGDSLPADRYQSAGFTDTAAELALTAVGGLARLTF